VSAPPYQGYDGGPPVEPPIDVDAGCWVALPYADPNHVRSCVQCTQDSQCGYPVPHCVTDTSRHEYGFCVQCTQDAHCADPTPYCELDDWHSNNGGLCVACSAAHSGVCDAGYACNTSLDVCQFDCLTDAGDCGLGYYCAYYGACVAGCLDAGDCPTSTPFCTSNGVCVPCLFGGDAGCDPDKVCRADDTCVPDCRLDAGLCPLDFTGPGFYCETDSGLCLTGCQANSDCQLGRRCVIPFPGVVGTCVDCLSAADCAAFAGCNGNSCGSCSQQSDCPAGLTCTYGLCTCASDSDCQNQDTPNCIDAGYVNLCGCSSTDACPLGTVCDPRASMGYYLFPHSGPFSNQPYVSYCVTVCGVEGGTDCSTTVYQTCDVDSGYCVGCTDDSHCQDPSQPHCVPFADAGYDAGIPYGGICGCTDSSQCNDGTVCDLLAVGFLSQPAPGVGECIAPCQRDAGYAPDTCPPQGAGYYCDTFNGVCYPCLDDYDCTGTNYGWGPDSNICIQDYGCVQCLDFTYCPADLPGCSASTYSCGYCDTVADCPPDAGFVYQCSPAFFESQLECVVACTADGGASQCPTARPFCDVDGGGFCAECLTDSDCAKGCCDILRDTCAEYCFPQ
jgi:hypothetical protein